MSKLSYIEKHYSSKKKSRHEKDFHHPKEVGDFHHPLEVGDFHHPKEVEDFQVVLTEDVSKFSQKNWVLVSDDASAMKKDLEEKGFKVEIDKDLEKEAVSSIPNFVQNPANLEAETTVHRDKFGRVLNKKVEAKIESLLQKQRQEDENEALKFKSGIAQERMLLHAKSQLEKEKSTGFSRYADDEEMNEDLKKKKYWGDALFNSGQKNIVFGRDNLNRFGIKPGFRWDGVERGNGFETRLFQKKNEDFAFKQDVYKWSTEDM